MGHNSWFSIGFVEQFGFQADFFAGPNKLLKILLDKALIYSSNVA